MRSLKIFEPIEVARFIPGRLLRDTRFGFSLSSSRIIPRGGKADVRSDQEWRQAGDDSLNKWDHFIKRFNDRLTLDPRFIERYVAGELQLLLHFFAGVGGGW